MKSLSKIIISILLSYNIALGQFSNRILNYCTSKDFVGLSILIDSLHETGNQGSINYSAHTEVNRQIIGKYYETIFYYEENQTNFLDYTIQLISDSNSITYCKIRSVEFVDKPEVVYYSLDEEKFNDLKKQYKKGYNNQVKIKDFFIDKVVYGNRCGKAPTPPEYREKVEKAIKHKNIHLLNTWLASVNTEKQVYAVEALLRLEKSGMILKPEQKQRMELVKNKSGTIRACGGCLLRKWTIDEALNYSLKWTHED